MEIVDSPVGNQKPSSLSLFSFLLKLKFKKNVIELISVTNKQFYNKNKSFNCFSIITYNADVNLKKLVYLKNNEKKITLIRKEELLSLHFYGKLR